MRKFRIGLIIVAIVISIAELLFIDFDHFALPKNFGPYWTLTGMIFVILSQVFEIRKSQNK